MTRTCLIDPWKADKTAYAVKTAKVVYYLAVVGVIVAGILGTHGMLGQNFQHFMNTTLSHHLPTKCWIAVGFGAAILPEILSQLIYKTHCAYQNVQRPLSRPNSPHSSRRSSSSTLQYKGL